MSEFSLTVYRGNAVPTITFCCKEIYNQITRGLIKLPQSISTAPTITIRSYDDEGDKLNTTIERCPWCGASLDIYQR